MNTRLSLLLSVVVWASAATAWSQDVVPLPAPTGAPGLPPPPPPLDSSPGTVAPAVPTQPPQVPYSPPPGSYPSPPPGSYPPPPPGSYPPPGPVIVAPGQPYPYPCPPPSPYAAPVVVPPPGTELLPVPPLPSNLFSAAVDALFLERSSGGSIPLGYTYVNPASKYYPTLPTDNLYSDDVPYPLAAGLRLEVSGKLDNNITLAATYWGLQQWSVGRTIYGDSTYDTVLAYSPYLQLPTLVPLQGLNGSLGYSDGSQIDNVEFNALFRLNPGNPYWEINWLWGARYIYFADQFTLTGFDAASGATEQLGSNTTNNLVGGQTGLLFTYGWSRFQWETGLKCGLMANIYRQHGSDTASNAPGGFIPYPDYSNSGCGLAALFEISLAARLRLTDNLWLRLGYQFYDITGLALAPRQLDTYGHGANMALDGFSIGLQGTW